MRRNVHFQASSFISRTQIHRNIFLLDFLRVYHLFPLNCLRICVLQKSAMYMYEELSHVPGLLPVRPQGAFYLMVRIDIASFPAFSNDLEFVTALVNEQSVMSLPASVCPLLHPSCYT